MKHLYKFCIPIKHICYFLLIACLASCAASSQRKSANYYHQNKQTINELKQLYEQLYLQQPFAAGFTDKSFQYYVMEVKTDTLRYIYNSEKNKEVLAKTIEKFKFDTIQLRKLAIKMKEIKSLWISKSTFFINEKRETVTFMTFKSVLTEAPFEENKYYTLLFLAEPIAGDLIKDKIKKGDLVKIEDLVYFMIGTKYR